MEIFVKGVRVMLTIEQIAQVKEELKKRQSYKNNFAKMLKHFGFKELKDQPNCFEHNTYNWFAQVQEYHNHHEVWMTGKGLKSMNAPPGGWMYGDPKEIEEELTNALEKI